MPSLEQYRALAPFSARELVEAANSLLRSKPELELSERTLRYYVSEGLLPSPEGPTKFARYSFDHLVGLAAIRFLQDHGINLERIRDELRSLFEPGDSRARALIVSRLADWLATQERGSAGELATELWDQSPRMMLSEVPHSYSRARSPSRPDLTTETVETLGAQVDELRRELADARSRRNDDWAQRSLETEVHRLHAILGELTDAVRELRSEVRELRTAREDPGDAETSD